MTTRIAGTIVALLALAGAAVAAPVGHVVAFTGEVSHLPGGSEAAAVPAALNTPLSLGDIVRTGEDGKARLLLGDDTVLTLAPSTTLRIDKTVFDPDEKEEVSRVSLLWGKVRAIVSRGFGEERGFEVQTETAVIGVKGTHFIVDSGSSHNALGTPGPCTAGILVNGTGIRVSNPDGYTDVDDSWSGSVACSAPSGPLPCPPACQQAFRDYFHIPPDGIMDPILWALVPGPDGKPHIDLTMLRIPWDVIDQDFHWPGDPPVDPPDPPVDPPDPPVDPPDPEPTWWERLIERLKKTDKGPPPVPRPGIPGPDDYMDDEPMWECEVRFVTDDIQPAP
jgi:hypothetical protein